MRENYFTSIGYETSSICSIWIEIDTQLLRAVGIWRTKNFFCKTISRILLLLLFLSSLWLFKSHGCKKRENYSFIDSMSRSFIHWFIQSFIYISRERFSRWLLFNNSSKLKTRSSKAQYMCFCSRAVALQSAKITIIIAREIFVEKMWYFFDNSSFVSIKYVDLVKNEEDNQTENHSNYASFLNGH